MKSILLKISGIAFLCFFLLTLPVSANTSGQLSNLIKFIPPSTPDTSFSSSSSENQVYISDFQSFLVEWNGKMNWSFSTQQIEMYNLTLENGLLKKYQTIPGYLTLDITDMKSFCLEVGDALGLTSRQSERFASAADFDLRKAKISSHSPVLLPESDSYQESSTLQGGESQSAPYAHGKIVYMCIIVDFTVKSTLPDGKSLLWTPEDRSDALNDAYNGMWQIQNQAPDGATMEKEPTLYQWMNPITITGSNPGRVESSMNENGWMEQAIIQMGFPDGSYDGTFDGWASDDFARAVEDENNADSVVIVYMTHDGQGGYAAVNRGYADKVVISYWGLNSNYNPPRFFESVLNSYEHEIVHTYGAVDEYETPYQQTTCGVKSKWAVSFMKEMYTSTNAYNCPNPPEKSIMKDVYDTTNIQQSARNFIGWGDFDVDGILDPDDVPPDGNGGSSIGVFRSGEWILDYGIDGTVNRRLNYGLPTDKPVVCDFNNDRATDIGVFRSGEWILDYGIDGTVNRRLNYGLPTDKPVVGDFNNDGTTDIGVFRSGEWILDYGIDGTVNRRLNYGLPTDTPLTGKWI